MKHQELVACPFNASRLAASRVVLPKETSKTRELTRMATRSLQQLRQLPMPVGTSAGWLLGLWCLERERRGGSVLVRSFRTQTGEGRHLLG